MDREGRGMPLVHVKSDVQKGLVEFLRALSLAMGSHNCAIEVKTFGLEGP